MREMRDPRLSSGYAEKQFQCPIHGDEYRGTHGDWRKKKHDHALLAFEVGDAAVGLAIGDLDSADAGSDLLARQLHAPLQEAGGGRSRENPPQAPTGPPA